MSEFLTLRQIFDKVEQHLRTQRVRAIIGSNSCLYRAGNLKCAVGCLISNETYDPHIEGCTPSSLWEHELFTLKNAWFPEEITK